MGKKRHTQDKLYITQKEIVNDWGGKREEHEHARLNRDNQVQRLPFNYCNLGLSEAKEPVCSIEEFSSEEPLFGNLRRFGVVYETANILQFLRKHKDQNPISGASLKEADLVKLTFHRNEEGELHCPVTYKKLTETVQMVAIKETGNVYSYQAYLEMNKQMKNYHDLLTDEPFDPKSSVLVINDPSRASLYKRTHVFLDGEEVGTIQQSGTAKRIMKQYEKAVTMAAESTSLASRHAELFKGGNGTSSAKPTLSREQMISKIFTSLEKQPEVVDLKEKVDSNMFLEYRRSVGKVRLPKQEAKIARTDQALSSSLTCTSLKAKTNNAEKVETDEQRREEYLQLIKSRQETADIALIFEGFGTLHFQIACSKVPGAAEFFLENAKLYKDLKVHTQPSKHAVFGKGKEVDAAKVWGNFINFRHEAGSEKKLRHSQRGILSIRNPEPGVAEPKPQLCPLLLTLEEDESLDSNRNTIPIGTLVSGFPVLEKIKAALGEKGEKQEVAIKEIVCLSHPFRQTIAEILLKDWAVLSKEAKKKYLAAILKKKKERDALAGITEIGKYMKKN